MTWEEKIMTCLEPWHRARGGGRTELAGGRATPQLRQQQLVNGSVAPYGVQRRELDAAMRETCMLSS